MLYDCLAHWAFLLTLNLRFDVIPAIRWDFAACAAKIPRYGAEAL
jgi:hypothetical protein